MKASGYKHQKAWKLKNKERNNEINRKIAYKNMPHLKRYGITKVDYDKMVADQNNLCAICKQPETFKRKKLDNQVARLAVDHCHKTGKVRGLLCRRCNQFLGHANEDIERLQSMIDYLRKV